MVRGGAGTALVGDPQTVADRILEYADLGIESFILSGYPHLEEAYRVVELLFPHLPLENLPTVEKQHVLSPFGEIVAADYNLALAQPAVGIAPHIEATVY